MANSGEIDLDAVISDDDDEFESPEMQQSFAFALKETTNSKSPPPIQMSESPDDNLTSESSATPTAQLPPNHSGNSSSEEIPDDENQPTTPRKRGKSLLLQRDYKTYLSTPIKRSISELLSSKDTDEIRNYFHNRTGQDAYRVPSQLRGEVWKQLLGVSRKSSALNFPESLRSTPLYTTTLSLCSSNILVQDRMREEEAPLNTHNNNNNNDNNKDNNSNDMEKEESDKMDVQMAEILTVYCDAVSINVREELVMMLFPFMTIGLSQGMIYNCFSAFIRKYAPMLLLKENVLNDSTYCISELFTLLLKYHDVEFTDEMEQYNFYPHGFITPTLCTLLLHPTLNLNESNAKTGDGGSIEEDKKAKDEELERLKKHVLNVKLIWDFVIISNDIFIFYFVLLALFFSRKKELFATLSSFSNSKTGSSSSNTSGSLSMTLSLPPVLTSTTLSSSLRRRLVEQLTDLSNITLQNLSSLFPSASSYSSTTPSSFRSQLHASLSTSSSEFSTFLLPYLSSTPLCFHISPADFLLPAAPRKFVIVDIRSNTASTSSGTLPISYKIPTNKEHFVEFVHVMGADETTSFVFIGSELEGKEESGRMKTIVNEFIRISRCGRVCIARGGFKTVHDWILNVLQAHHDDKTNFNSANGSGVSLNEDKIGLIDHDKKTCMYCNYNSVTSSGGASGATGVNSSGEEDKKDKKGDTVLDKIKNLDYYSSIGTLGSRIGSKWSLWSGPGAGGDEAEQRTSPDNSVYSSNNDGNAATTPTEAARDASNNSGPVESLFTLEEQEVGTPATQIPDGGAVAGSNTTPVVQAPLAAQQQSGPQQKKNVIIEFQPGTLLPKQVKLAPETSVSSNSVNSGGRNLSEITKGLTKGIEIVKEQSSKVAKKLVEADEYEDLNEFINKHPATWSYFICRNVDGDACFIVVCEEQLLFLERHPQRYAVKIFKVVDLSRMRKVRPGKKNPKLIRLDWSLGTGSDVAEGEDEALDGEVFEVQNDQDFRAAYLAALRSWRRSKGSLEKTI